MPVGRRRARTKREIHREERRRRTSRPFMLLPGEEFIDGEFVLVGDAKPKAAKAPAEKKAKKAPAKKPAAKKAKAKKESK